MTAHSQDTVHGELLQFPGSLMVVRVSATSNADRISVIENRMPYGESPPLHIHRNEDEIFHVLEGTVRFNVDGKDLIAHAGQTALAPKGIPHSFRVESKEGAVCLVITHGGDFERMVREVSVPTASTEVAPFAPPSPAAVASLIVACTRNHIDIVGAPLS